MILTVGSQQENKIEMEGFLEIFSTRKTDREWERQRWLNVKISVNPEAMGNLDMNTYPQVFGAK